MEKSYMFIIQDSSKYMTLTKLIQIIFLLLFSKSILNFFLKFFSANQMTTNMRVYEYINSLISLLPQPDEFKLCDFTLLCEKYPINIGKGTYLAHVLYISLKSNDNSIRIYPNQLKEMNLEKVVLTSNIRRRINTNSPEFFVNGNNEEQIFKEHSFYNYSIEKVDKSNKEMILKLREKYEIAEPQLFKGVHQNIVLDDL